MGKADPNPEEIEGPRVDRDTPGRPQEEDNYATHPSLAGEVPRDQPQDQIKVVVESETYREAKVRQMAQKREKGRQTSRRAT